MNNTQPIEKRALSGDGSLEVHSIFNTIQGEGPFTGQQAIFIRLAGCNLQCPKCDTDYTSKRITAPVNTVMTSVRNYPSANDLVVLTGGEPFRQDIGPLVRQLLNDGYRVQIETNGTLAPPSRSFATMVQTDLARPDGCFIVCSPKTGKVNPELEPLICAYKYVVRAGNVMEDGLPLTALDHTAVPHVARPPSDFFGPIYVQPCDEQSEESNQANLETAIHAVMQHGHTLQIQVHKLIRME